MVTASLPIEIVLDRSLRAIREKSYSIEDCLAHYPAHKAELEPLLILVLRLQSARTLEAPAEFRNVALARMNNLINSRPRPTKKRARAKLASFGNGFGFSMASPKNRFSFKFAIIAGFSLFILLAASAGAVYAASNALPGNVFYPFKNTVEMAQLAISPDVIGDATLYLNFSQQRLEETEVLLRTQQFGEAKFSLIDYQVDASNTLETLGKNSLLTDKQRIDFAHLTIETYSHNKAHLLVFLSQTPEIVRPSVEGALNLTNQVLERALQLIGEAPKSLIPETEQMKWAHNYSQIVDITKPTTAQEYPEMGELVSTLIPPTAPPPSRKNRFSKERQLAWQTQQDLAKPDNWEEVLSHEVNCPPNFTQTEEGHLSNKPHTNNNFTEWGNGYSHDGFSHGEHKRFPRGKL